MTLAALWLATERSMRDREAWEFESGLVAAIGEVDGVIEVRALSMSVDQILAQHRPTNLSLYVRVADSPLENPGAGNLPNYDQRWNLQVMVCMPQRTRAEDVISEFQHITDLLRSRLSNVILLSGDGGRFIPTPLRIVSVSPPTPTSQGFFVGTVACTTVTSFVGDRPVASTSGSGFPSSPNSGDQHFLTPDMLAFRYDGSRWAIEAEMPFPILTQGTYNEAATFEDITHMAVAVPHDLIVRRIFVGQTAAGVDAFNVLLKKNDVTVATLAFTAAATGLCLDLATPVVFDEGDKLEIWVSGGGSVKPTGLVAIIMANEIRS